MCAGWINGHNDVSPIFAEVAVAAPATPRLEPLPLKFVVLNRPCGILLSASVFRRCRHRDRSLLTKLSPGGKERSNDQRDVRLILDHRFDAATNLRLRSAIGS